MDWKKPIQLFQEINIQEEEGNQLVRIGGVPQGVVCVGRGTDAAVFVHEDHPGYAYKVYAATTDAKRKNEEEAYRKLGNNPYFPTYYGSAERCLVLSYEQGKSLYDCLIEGIEIPAHVITQVDEAIAYARSVGLNPRDVHVKNILLQGEVCRVVDVSEYVKEGNDRRWEHLKEGYRLYYPLIAARKIPPALIEFVKKQYWKKTSCTFSVQAFGRFLLPLLGIDKQRNAFFL